MEQQRRAGSSPLGVAAHGAGDHSPEPAGCQPGRAGAVRVDQRDRAARDDLAPAEPRRAVPLSRRGARGHHGGDRARDRPRAGARPREPALRADEQHACGRDCDRPRRALALPLPDARVRRHPRARAPLRRPRAQARLGVLRGRGRARRARGRAADDRRSERAAPRLLDDAGGQRRAGTRPAPRRRLPDRGSTIPPRRSWPHIASSAGAAQSADDVVSAPGVYCYAVFALGALGRPGALATVSHTYLGRLADRARSTGRSTGAAHRRVHRHVDRHATGRSSPGAGTSATTRPRPSATRRTRTPRPATTRSR